MIYVILIAFLCFNLECTNFYEDCSRGWHWYEDPMPIPNEKSLNNFSPKPKSATESMQTYKKNLEELLNKAIITPSPYHIKRYQMAQKGLMDRAEQFAKNWQEVVRNHPELDYTLISPVNQKARHIAIDLKKKASTHLIKKMKKEWGLFFFFSSNCGYCTQFAPIVKQFSYLYEFEIVPISKDGSSLPEFENPKPDPGIFDAWGMDIYPALFAVNPKTEEIVPIAFGFMSLEDIENRMGELAKRIDKEGE